MSESGHWYKPDGTPCHSLVGQNGKERPTTLRDAKKLGLLPSVSGITRVMAAPDLEDWKTRQVIDAAYGAYLFGKFDNKEEYCKFVLDSALGPVEEASKLGTHIHKALESWLTGADLDYDFVVTMPTGAQLTLRDLISPAIAKLDELGLEIVESEKVLVNLPYRYAGTTDILYKCGDKIGVLDFKSKRTKAGEKIRTVPSYPMQIAAYFAASWGNGDDYPIKDSAEGINLYISTTEPGRVEEHVYDSERLEEEWQAFKHCRALYKHRNKL
jgi:hypothetical protein